MRTGIDRCAHVYVNVRELAIDVYRHINIVAAVVRVAMEVGIRVISIAHLYMYMWVFVL
jgi:hypothetical protein